MERQMYHYATVTKALKDLKDKGFTTDFNLDESRIVNNPSDFSIEHIYRYEGESDPGDEATVYGICSTNGERGVFVAGNLAYSENNAAQVLHEISIEGRKNTEGNA